MLGDHAQLIQSAYNRHSFELAEGADAFNITYIEGMGLNGKANANTPNTFCDIRCLLQVINGSPIITGWWEATIKPSRYWTINPMHPKGAFHIALGRQAGWTVGFHHQDPNHEALIQCGVLNGFRDPNKTFKRDLDHPWSGDDMGVNQHWGYNLPSDDLGTSSAGCLVGRLTEGHKDFMMLLKSDRRYLSDRKGWRFPTCIFTAQDVLQLS